MGNDRLAVVHLEKAMRLFEQVGNHSAALYTKATIVEQGLGHRAIEQIVSEMEALLVEAAERTDKDNVAYLQLRLIDLTKSAGQYDKMEVYVSALEKFPLSTPIKADEYGKAIHAKLGRADLLMVQKNLVEAERVYQKALRLCEAEPSRWLEIHVLHTLANLEWGRQNANLAKAYLDSAFVRADRLELHEHLATNFDLKAMIAEAEKRYADALGFTKKRQFHQAIFDKRGAGFNVQSYFLQLEKDQLAAEKEMQTLQLRLKNSQLRNSLLVAGLLLLVVVGLFVSLRTQRKGKKTLAAQNALILQQSEQLRGHETAKSRFFANISHELRTPLSLILGSISDLKKEGGKSEKQERLLQIASRGGQSLHHLVNQILDLGKLDAGKMQLHREPVQAAAFFANYFAQFESLAERNRVQYTLENELQKSSILALDKEKCRQIVYNLLSNAFKFTHAGGTVTGKLEIGNWEIGKSGIGELERTGAHQIPISNLIITVSDTGEGIHPSDLPHIFERYFQTNRHDAPAMGGTGIGLALCQDYVQLLGGKIEVESTLGKGTTFRVSFPVQAVGSEQGEDLGALTPQKIVEDDRPHAASSKAKPSILVVEDNPDLQDYFRLILQEKFNVVTAGNGQEALGVLMAENGTGGPAQFPELILSDLMMPVMDGYQLLEKLKSNGATRHLPVIMLTARAEARDRLKALRIGVDDYLTKPFDEEELLVRIENLLRNRAARQEPTPLPEMGAEGVPATLSSEDLAWLENFEAFVRKNLSKNTLAVPLLAHAFAMSESTLLRHLKRLTGLTPQQYLTEMRLHVARQILESGDARSIAKVADSVGYVDVRSFSRSFKGRFGQLPSDFLSH